MSGPTPATPAYDAPTADDLRFVAEEVWRALLGEEELLEAAEDTDSTEDTAWSGAVSVSGAWQGTVGVELGATAAADLAARMLALPAGESPDDSDVADAVGELVNMVGGNVKSLMDGPSVLSLPLVAAGRAAPRSDVAEVAEVARLEAGWRGRPVRFAVACPRT